jgi:hypothetical protein
MRGAATCFGFLQPSSGSSYMCFAKVTSITNQLNILIINTYKFSKAHTVAPWWWLWETETCRSTSYVNFNILKCISWINERLYSIKMHGATVEKKRVQDCMSAVLLRICCELKKKLRRKSYRCELFLTDTFATWLLTMEKVLGFMDSSYLGGEEMFRQLSVGVMNSFN